MPVDEGRTGADRADGREPAWGVLATVVIDEYDALPPLPTLRTAVAEAGTVLGHAGFARVDLTADGRARSVVDALAAWRPQTRRVVLHWAGHGKEVDRNAFFLLCRDSSGSEEPDERRAVAARVLGGLLADLQVAETVLLLDVCGAGGGAGEVVGAFSEKISRQAHAGLAPSLAVISSTRRSHVARESALSRGIAAALRDGPPQDPSYLPWTDRDSHINPTELAWAVDVTLRALSAGSQVPEVATTGMIGRVFPNPRHRPTVPDADLDPWSRPQRRSPVSPDAAEHFLAKFRGLDATGEQGWHFTGRTAVLRRLVAWLRDGRGIRVVTGSAGCGKSALLGRLAMLSFRDYRAEVEGAGGLAGHDAGTLPPVDAISAGVHARGKSLADCVRDLRAALDLPAPPGGSNSPAELLAQVSARSGTTTVLFDALDEAQAGDVRRIATDLLRPMGELPGVRLLVATRPGATGSLLADLGAGPEETLWLDRDPDQIADVAAYARRRLRVPGSVYADEPDAVVDPVADAIAAHSRGIFLLARLLARTLARWGAVVDTGAPEVRALFAGGLQSVFVADLERFGPDEKRARLLLRALAWGAGRGVPGRDVWLAIARALGGSYTEADLGWLAEHAGANIVASSEDGQTVYRLYHEAFTDYFRAGADERRIQDAITSALLETVTHDGVQRWADANPYVLRHLAEHAARAGRLRGLVSDPGFLLHGDPDRLLQSAGDAFDDASPLARVYLRAVTELPGSTPTQRIVILATTALQHEPDAVAALRDAVDLPWRPLWSRTRRTAFYRPLGRHGHPVLCVAVGQVGGRDIVASGGGDHVVRLWDATSVTGRTTFVGHRAPVFAVALATVDGRAVLVSGDSDGLLCVWDVAIGRMIAEHRGPAGVLALAALPEGTDGPIVAVGDVTGRIALHRLPGLEVLVTFPDHHAAVRSLHVMRSRGRSILVSGGDDGTLRMWGPRATFATTGHVVAADSARLLGRPVVATGGYWGTVALWDADTGVVIHSFAGHPRTVNAIAFAPTDDGVLLATAGDDGGIRVWDPSTGRPIRVLRIGRTARRTVLEKMVKTTVRALTAGGWVGAEDLDATVGRRHSDSVLALRFLAVRDRPTLISGGVDGWVRSWDVVPASGATDTHDTAVTALCAGVVDGRPVVVVGRRSGALQVVEATSGRLLLDVSGSAPVQSLALGTVRGRMWIARGDEDHQLMVFDATSGRSVGVRFAHTNDDLPLYGIAFASGARGTLLVHTLDQGAVALVDTVSGARREIAVGDNAVVHLAAGPTGSGLLATAPVEGDVTISTVDEGPVHTVEAVQLTCRPAFGTSEGRAVLAFSDIVAGVVLVVRAPGWAPRTLVERHALASTVTGLAFTDPGPDGRPLLVVTRDDGSARAHDLNDGSVRVELPARPDAVRAVTTLPDGRRSVIVYGDEDGVHAVDLDLEAALVKPAG